MHVNISKKQRSTDLLFLQKKNNNSTHYLDRYIPRNSILCVYLDWYSEETLQVVYKQIVWIGFEMCALYVYSGVY